MLFFDSLLLFQLNDISYFALYRVHMILLDLKSIILNILVNRSFQKRITPTLKYQYGRKLASAATRYVDDQIDNACCIVKFRDLDAYFSHSSHT